MNNLSIIEALLIGLIVSLILILVIDTIQIGKLKKLIYTEQSGISIEKYHELKWRINLFISITTSLAIALGFIGFSVKNIMSEEINLLQTKINHVDSLIANATYGINTIDANANSLNTKFISINKQLHQLGNDILNLQSTNLRKWEFQIITDIPIKLNANKLIDTIYFSQIRLADGNKLPAFNKPPLVNLIRNEKIDWLLFHTKTTEKYFILEETGSAPANFVVKDIDIWIMFK
jgi:hypothetical protein